MSQELVLVTGASTGIGHAIAKRMIQHGFRVAAGVRKQKDFAAWQETAFPVILDVADPESVKRGLDALRPELDRAARVHLVNNAGIAVSGPVEGVPVEKWREQFEVNVFGLVRMSQALMPWVRATRGRIVNISSISGRATSPFLGPYSASKFAVEAISDAMRRELARFGVGVVVIEPGPIATPIWDKNFSKLESELAELGPEMVRLYGPEMRRFAELAKASSDGAPPPSKVAEVAHRALTLAKPRTRYVVGKTGLPAQVMLTDYLPDRWLDAMIAKGFLRKE